MTVVYDDTFWVHYGQAYVLSAPGDVGPDLDECFAGQANGLLGAASPGRLWLTTGLHTGEVRLHIEVLDSEPAVDDAWEEIVDASFLPASSSAAVYPWGSDDAIPLGIERAPHRVRYCAMSMDAARCQDTLEEDQPPIDSYALLLWPAPAAPDRVVKQTGETAGYWHRWARGERI